MEAKLQRSVRPDLVARFGPVVLALAVVASPVAAVEPTTIGFTIDWPVPVVLEVGNLTQPIEAGGVNAVTDIVLKAPTIVRVRRRSDCQPLLRFVAQPGGSYWIYMNSERVMVKDLHGAGTDSGPGFDLQVTRVCPALPDTSTVAPAPADRSTTSWVVPLLMLGVLTLAVLALSSPGRRRGRRAI